MNAQARPNLRLIRPMEDPHAYPVEPWERAMMNLPPVSQQITVSEKVCNWVLLLTGLLMFWYGSLGFLWWCCR